MLSFRWMVAALLVGAAYMAAVVLTLDSGDVGMPAFGPRPAVATTAALRLVPPAPAARESERTFAMPAPVAPPVRARAAEQSESQRTKPKAAVHRKDSEEHLPSPLHFFFPYLFDRNGKLHPELVPQYDRAGKQLSDS